VSDFSAALTAARDGKKISRPGKGGHVVYQPGKHWSMLLFGYGSSIEFWQPTQADILAEDWEISE
jgi:uncharacterized protein DUF2829